MTEVIDVKDYPTAISIVVSELGQPKNFQEAAAIVTLALKLLVISKNQKYGKDNINRFGSQGIFMRLWDKIMRLEQKLFKGVELGSETELDTWGDVSGYGIVGVLKQLGWYDLPIET